MSHNEIDRGKNSYVHGDYGGSPGPNINHDWLTQPPTAHLSPSPLPYDQNPFNDPPQRTPQLGPIASPRPQVPPRGLSTSIIVPSPTHSRSNSRGPPQPTPSPSGSRSYYPHQVNDAPAGKVLQNHEKPNEEFAKMRYSAVTCDPDSFKASNFTLRQKIYNRKTELLIAITMYNEGKDLLRRTMRGVMENIVHLHSRKGTMWVTDGWKKVVVCIISDGRQEINEDTLRVIVEMGAYRDGTANGLSDGKEVTAHIYEHTTLSSCLSPKNQNTGTAVPVQILFCLKEKNQKKLNSHRWLFKAFCPIMNPNVCILLDVGTEPGRQSIYHLWNAFNINPHVGGACGEIIAWKGKYWKNMLNPLVAAQNFEYKISNILDKPFESVFGYVSVLPGAFSAYRYKALTSNYPNGAGPDILQNYLLGDNTQDAAGNNNGNPVNRANRANMYLAEDRMLCWELVTKPRNRWILRYVKSAYAVTDVPVGVPDLILQRRRWLNGSFFAAIHNIRHFYYIYRSSHSFMRKFWIHLEILYQAFNLLFSWFAFGNYYISFIILSEALEDPSFNLGKVIHPLNIVLNYAYLGLVIMCFLQSLGNRPKNASWFFYMAFLGFAIITVYMVIAACLLVFKGVTDGPHTILSLFTDHSFRDIVVSLVATIGLYFLSSLLFFDPWHMITSFIQYLVIVPSYISVLNIYAFSNAHDFSWGTKGHSTASGPPSRVEEEDHYRSFRTNVLLIWTLTNALLAAIVTSVTGKAVDRGANNTVNGYFIFVLYSIAALTLMRFIGSMTYMVMRWRAGE